jgi:hypothetical protein
MTAAEYKAQLKPKKRQKYNAKLCVIDGKKFHSIGEGKRWLVLRQYERDGKITELRRQVKYALLVTDCTVAYQPLTCIGYYVCDFDYLENGRLVIEDWKGFDTDFARWKRKHLEAQLNCKILLTGPAAKRSKR